MLSSIVFTCRKALAKNNLLIAFAESILAERLAAKFSLTPESVQVLFGGLVCYDAEIKTSIQGVPQSLRASVKTVLFLASSLPFFSREG